MAVTGTKQQRAPKKARKTISLDEEGPLRLPDRLPYRSSVPIARIRAAVRKVIAARSAAQSVTDKAQ